MERAPYRPYRVEIPLHEWEPIGYDCTGEDPHIRLMSPGLVICGVPMHLMAYAVTKTGDKYEVQAPAHEQLEEVLDALAVLNEGYLETHQFYGNEYVFVAFPHSRS